MNDLIHYAEFTDDGVLVGLYRSDAFPPNVEPIYGDVGGEQKVIGSRVVSRNDRIPARAHEISAEDYARIIANPAGIRWNGSALADAEPFDQTALQMPKGQPPGP